MRTRESRGTPIVESVSDTGGASTALTGQFAATAGKRNYVKAILIHNSSATPVTVDIRDGAAGAVMFTFHAPNAFAYLFELPDAFQQPTVNTALAFDPSAAVTTLRLTFIGWKGD